MPRPPGGTANTSTGTTRSASSPKIEAEERSAGYTTGMTYHVGAKGQVVIPKHLREALGLRPGQSVQFARVGDGVVLRKAATASSLKGRFARQPLAAALLEERRKDRVREARVR